MYNLLPGRAGEGSPGVWQYDDGGPQPPTAPPPTAVHTGDHLLGPAPLRDDHDACHSWLGDMPTFIVLAQVAICFRQVNYLGLT